MSNFVTQEKHEQSSSAAAANIKSDGLKLSPEISDVDNSEEVSVNDFCFLTFHSNEMSVAIG